MYRVLGFLSLQAAQLLGKMIQTCPQVVNCMPKLRRPLEREMINRWRGDGLKDATVVWRDPHGHDGSAFQGPFRSEMLHFLKQPGCAAKAYWGLTGDRHINLFTHAQSLA